MHSENDIDRKNFQCKVEEFLDHSQSYLNGLPIIKRQLQEIDRLNEADTDIEKLSESNAYLLSQIGKKLFRQFLSENGACHER